MSALAEGALRDAAPMGFIESLDDIGHATARRLAHAAADALHAELSLYPKPGLVSFVDNGSHADMTAATFLCSIDALHGYFKAISALGAQRSQAAPFAALEQLGIAAERHMLRATGGVNTHRGAIFVIGMLCAAAGAAGAGDRHVSADGLRRRLLADWGTDLHARVALDAPSHGQRAALGHRLRGARAEAAAGFPVLFEHAVPALREALAAGLDDRRAHLQTFFVAMSELDDTNLVHRAGVDGLRHAKQSARAFLAAGGACAADASARAEQIHRDFVQRRLSPGGAADILAASIWTVRVCG